MSNTTFFKPLAWNRGGGLTPLSDWIVLFSIYFCCHKWQRCGTKLQNSLRHGQQGRWPLSLTRMFSTNQTIKPCKTHDVSIFWHGLGSRGSVSPCSLTGSFYFGLFIILLPPVAALWNQTVEFVWHGQQGGGLTPFTDWIVLFFPQAKPSNNVYFWFFEEEVVWPHYLECWSFFDRFRHSERSKQWNQGELPISPFFVWQPAWKEDKFKQTNGRWSDLPTPLWRNCSV